jgi:hypothetical protein
MRKIEAQMIEAIRNCKGWKSANTEVAVMNDGVSYVYLYGKKIAEIGDDYITLFDAGYRSNTVKSRLNAILSTFGSNFDSIFQKDFQWFFHDSLRSVDVPFENGMVIA